jgi:hypothetical protein
MKKKEICVSRKGQNPPINFSLNLRNDSVNTMLLCGPLGTNEVLSPRLQATAREQWPQELWCGVVQLWLHGAGRPCSGALASPACTPFVTCGRGRQKDQAWKRKTLLPEKVKKGNQRCLAPVTTTYPRHHPGSPGPTALCLRLRQETLVIFLPHVGLSLPRLPSPSSFPASSHPINSSWTFLQPPPAPQHLPDQIIRMSSPQKSVPASFP